MSERLDQFIDVSEAVEEWFFEVSEIDLKADEDNEGRPTKGTTYVQYCTKSC